ncbi:MAG: 2-C-methyl-D-erythritol 2,4-cyclodiphosphate synthase [Spirochaetales bacterium]|nr:2-C-methyl-D-erythritol 2,4-cyclodiphosphate synthase [Spirochaetales bacterium]
MSKTFSVVIPAAGLSTRMKKSTDYQGGKKEYLPMKSVLFQNEKASTVLSCVAEAFLLAAKNNPQYKLRSIVVVIPPDDDTANLEAYEAFFASPQVSLLAEQLTARIDFVPGGETRQESVKIALDFLSQLNPDFVAIHDGARPWIRPELIEKCLKTAFEKGSCAPIIKVVDTIKKIDGDDQTISSHLRRDELGAIQTPQVFDFQKLLKANVEAEKNNFSATDDTEIWGAFSGEKVFFCEGDENNKKITYISDVKDLCNKNCDKSNTVEDASDTKSTPGCSMPDNSENSSTSAHVEQDKYENQEIPFRIGLGYDLHALVEGRPLILGGIKIESTLGEDGHSDGDVLLHAITDALLGAAGLGDIGEFFPPSDDKWKDADSKMLLKTSWDKILENKWKLCNLDCVINIEKPKILPHRNAIRKSIAQILGCDENQIFVKAKTGEKLGEIGQSKAVQVWCTALLTR